MDAATSIEIRERELDSERTHTLELHTSQTLHLDSLEASGPSARTSC